MSYRYKIIVAYPKLNAALNATKQRQIFVLADNRNIYQMKSQKPRQDHNNLIVYVSPYYLLSYS